MSRNLKNLNDNVMHHNIWDLQLQREHYFDITDMLHKLKMEKEREKERKREREKERKRERNTCVTLKQAMQYRDVVHVKSIWLKGEATPTTFLYLLLPWISFLF